MLPIIRNPVYNLIGQFVYCFRPKPVPKPVEKPEEPRKLSEPFPKPLIRKLPQRKMSDAISLPMHITYENSTKIRVGQLIFKK